MQNAVFILIDLGILALIGHGVKLREGDWRIAHDGKQEWGTS